jgi:hypothetical protein
MPLMANHVCTTTCENNFREWQKFVMIYGPIFTILRPKIIAIVVNSITAYINILHDILRDHVTDSNGVTHGRCPPPPPPHTGSGKQSRLRNDTVRRIGRCGFNN